MQMLHSLVLVVQLLSALAMIGLVLVQHGKGADMGASFGSGASGSLFGATGSANFLSRSTAACATVFFVCTLALAFLSNQRGQAGEGAGSSVLDRAAPTAPAAVNKAEPAAAAQIPGAASAPAAASVPVPAAAPASGAAAIPTK
jgi:preprotein translocase subunit SecG